jgi:hypothetical protein
MQKELWDYVVRMVEWERRQKAIRQKRQVAAHVLCDPMRSDENAIKTARLLLS